MTINLIDQGTEYIIDEFYKKASILETFGEEMSPEDFYEEAFYDLDLIVPTICLSLPRREMSEVQSLYDAIDFSKGRNDVLLGSCTSYSENYISKNLVHEVYAFVIDLDNVTSRTLAESFTEDVLEYLLFLMELLYVCLHLGLRMRTLFKSNLLLMWEKMKYDSEMLLLKNQ